MRKAKLTDKELVIDILTQSFDTNASVNYVVKQDKKRTDRIRGLMGYSFNVCHAFGEVLLNDEKNTCALLLFEDQKKNNLNTISWDAKLALNTIGLLRVPQVLKREAVIKKHHPSKPFTYLWFIGVKPEHQGKSFGSKLLSKIIQSSVNREKPIYLETSVEKNVLWYETFGFKVYNQLNFGHNLFLLKKEDTPGA